jgi:3-phenylpropionate/trans-cinnamate dioxygenase ferredoxin reductase subunit
MRRFKLVIAGGGLAAARAIRSYREAGGEGAIALLSQETTLPYHRPPLSKGFLRGELDGDTLVEQEDFYREHGVEVLLGTTVTAVTPQERTVTAGGNLYRFDSLLLATGAGPRRLDVSGADLAGVFNLRTNADAQAIREAAREAREAVVVGGGFIGIEVAASLRRLGAEMTLVHRDPGLFQLLGAPELEHDLADLVRTNGVELILPDEVARFEGRGGHVDSVVTRLGRTLASELVVVGVGVEPVVDYLAGSGIDVANGIVVDERFETNIQGIYAVGDVASFHDPLYGRRRRIEHWSNAAYAGTQVGKILAGEDAPYAAVSSFFTEAFGVTIKVLGDQTGNDRLVTSGSLRERDLLGLYLDGDRLVAALLVGQSPETEANLKRLIEQRASLATAPFRPEETLAQVAA